MVAGKGRNMGETIFRIPLAELSVVRLRHRDKTTTEVAIDDLPSVAHKFHQTGEFSPSEKRTLEQLAGVFASVRDLDMEIEFVVKPPA